MLAEKHPDIQIYCGSIDRELNEMDIFCQDLVMQEIVSLVLNNKIATFH